MQLVVAALYLFFGMLVHHFIINNGIVSVLWPGSGLALAALLIGGKRFIWGVLLGSLTLNFLAHTSLWAVVGITLANVLEVIFAVWLLNRDGRSSSFLHTLPDYLRLIALGGAAACLVGAIVGTSSLVLAGTIAPIDYFTNAIHWWMGDVLGVVLITPLMLAWWQSKADQPTIQQRIESVLLLITTFIAGQIAFLGWFQGYLSDTPKDYWMFLFVAWVAIRMGARGVMVVMLMIAIQGLPGAYQQVGFFAHDIDRAGLNNYWAYMLILSVVGMAMTTYVHELKQGLAALKLKDSALNAAANGIVITDVNGRIEWANQAFSRLTGFSLSEAYGHNHRELVKSGKQDTAFYQRVWNTILSKNIWRGEIINRRKDGSLYNEDMTITPIADEQGSITHFVAVKQDITENKLVHGYEQFRSHILQLLAEGKSIPVILEAIVRGVEQLHPAMLCSILLLERDGLHLGNCVAPSLPDFYNDAINGVEIGIGVGSCGTAAFTGKRVIVEDITTHPYWIPYKALAASAGLGACWSQPIRSSAGQVLGTFAIYHHDAHTPLASDIAIIEQSANLVSISIDRKQSEEKLRVSDLALKAISQGVLITSADRRILSVNDAFLAVTGYSRSEVQGHSCRFMQGPLTDPQAIAAIALAIENITEFSGVILNYRKDGRTFWNELVITPVLDEQGKLSNFIGITRDISERKQMEEQVQHLAFYDPLTQLPNRRLLNDRLSQSLAASRRSACYNALIFLDLDNFKPLNDTHGHVVGDLLLVEVANRLRNCVREIDTVARFGGDEFVVMLSEVSENKAESITLTGIVAEKIRTALSEPYLLSLQSDRAAAASVEHRCTASIGIAMFSDEVGSCDDILKWADVAMYQAKEAGRNQICFYQ